MISVVAYHAFPTLLPGGFVGVDIFFVISGFLITGILQREMSEGRYSIVRFYTRRAKRLFPALATVLAATLAIAWLILLRHELEQLGKHTIAGTLFLANLASYLDTGYFDVRSKLEPLLHLWSLGVEEQFYLVWPLLIAAAMWMRIPLAGVCVCLAMLSFGTSMTMLESNPDGAFFLPHARFWELMVGGLLAVSGAHTTNQNKGHTSLMPALAGASRQHLCEFAAICGLLLIGLALSLINSTRAFPGWWALLPVTGSALLIAAGPDTRIARFLLSHRLAVFFGLISYPLYLWHWPLLTFGRILQPEGIPPAFTIALVALSILLAWLTYRWVELPIRDTRFSKLPERAGVSLAVAGLCVAGTAGYAFSRGFPDGRLHDFSNEITNAVNDTFYPGDAAISTQGIGTGNEKVLFLGDSYVRQLYPRVQHLMDSGQATRAVIFATANGCAPVPGVGRKSTAKCADNAEQGFRRAMEDDIAAVVAGGSWTGMQRRGDYYRLDDPDEAVLDLYDTETLEAVLSELGKTLTTLTASGKTVYLVLQPPGDGVAHPGAIGMARITGVTPLQFRQIPTTLHNAQTAEINALLTSMAHDAGATTIDPAHWICDDNGCAVTDLNGIPRYKDATHFRASFIRSCVKDFDALLIGGSDRGEGVTDALETAASETPVACTSHK